MFEREMMKETVKFEDGHLQIFRNNEWEYAEPYIRKVAETRMLTCKSNGTHEYMVYVKKTWEATRGAPGSLKYEMMYHIKCDTCGDVEMYSRKDLDGKQVTILSMQGVLEKE